MSHILCYLLFIFLLSLLVMSIVYAQNPVPTHTVNSEYIKEWLVVGPFFPNELDTDFLADLPVRGTQTGAGGEANIEPKEGSTVTTADGTILTWKRYASESNTINLLDAVGKHENATAYAFCLLESGIAGDVDILLGNDDQAAVWVAGKQAHSNPGGWTVTPDQHCFEVDLKAGKSPCLVKISQGNGPWGFAMRVLPINRAMISGLITDEKGQPIPNADVRLEQDGREILQAKTDASGNYRMGVYPVDGKYELSVTAGVRGAWKSDIPLREDDRKTLNVTLKEAISISGTLLMLDDATPHVAVVVQAVTPAPNGQSEPTVVATALSDESGRYRFINLKPRQYQVRCYTKSGYVYYQQGEVLHVQGGKAFLSIDFRFAPFKKGVWRHYTPLDGLVHNAVNRIYVEPNGVMWFGTERGISRYDGKTFVNFTTEDGFSNSGIWAIHRNPDGVMWFGTWDAGVSRYDGKGFVNFTTKDGLAANRVYYIFRTPDGAMWFWTEQGAVSRYDGKAFVNFSTTQEALASNYFVLGTLQDHRDSDGGLWFPPSWGGGVSRYDGKAVVNFTTTDGLPSNAVNASYRDGDGSMWFVTYGGVSRYDGKRFLNFTTKDGLVNNIVSCSYRTPDGAVWFGTRGGGVSRYDGKGFVNFTTADGLLSNVVTDLHLRDDGVLWVVTGSGIVGSERGGVSRYDEKGLVNFTTKDGLVNNHIIEHYQDSDGVLWIGTNGGVSRYDGHQFKNFTTTDGLTSNPVTAISRALDGTMWFGTSSDGVFRYDGTACVNFTTEDGLANNIVTAIHCDPDGVLWFGTGDYWQPGNGVSRYDGERFLNFTTTDGLADNSVLAIDCFVGFDTPSALNPAPRNDRDGMMWFGTRYNGVSRYDGQAFLNLTNKDGLVHNWVRFIHQDPDGIMWFGTSGGVSRYDGKAFLNFTTKDGLASNYVRAIHRHTDGIIWFATGTRGISGYDGVAWTSLDTRDGLAGNTVSSISQAADGSLWFGTDGGMTRYQRSYTKPKVHIVSVTTDQTYRDVATIPTMTIGTRVIFAYNAIDFKTIPEKRQYRLRIIGDNGKNEVDWQITKDATFNHLFKTSGTYTFEVVVIDRDLNYSLPASVTLKVVPPFYMTAVFLTPTVSLGGILLVGLTISLILLFKHRRRIRSYERLAVQELQDANRVQMSLMPDTAPPMEGVEIAGKCIPANTVSGDFFDYLQSTKKNEIGLVVADVCGKAMKGAMNAVMTDGILRTTAMEQGEFTSASLMMTLNNVLKGSMEWGMNVTMVIGMIDAATKTLTLANAGHHAYPILLHNSNIQRLEAKGMPLGMRAGVQYREEQFPLQSGDVLILMTDGIIEAKDNEENDYSESGRLEQTILQFTHDMPAEAMVEAIINDAIDYSGDKLVRDDDMTVVVAKIQ